MVCVSTLGCPHSASPRLISKGLLPKAVGIYKLLLPPDTHIFMFSPHEASARCWVCSLCTSEAAPSFTLNLETSTLSPLPGQPCRASITKHGLILGFREDWPGCSSPSLHCAGTQPQTLLPWRGPGLGSTPRAEPAATSGQEQAFLETCIQG